MPQPYNELSSDSVKRWTKELEAKGFIDEEAEGNEKLKELTFTNGLVLKINQLSKQVRKVSFAQRT